MKYGTIQEVEIHHNGLLIITEEKWHDSMSVAHETRYSEPVLIKDTNEALSAFLSVLDKFNNGEITEFGIKCHTDKQGKLIRAEKYWTVRDLH